MDAGTPALAMVYGESPTTLYKLDPLTKEITTVGKFTGCDSDVIDIALNKEGQMYATTFGGLYTIDKTTAACTVIALGSYPNSLSFIPAGELEANTEALVGYLGASYVQINPTTGAVTTIGSLGNSGYSSSGDIVSVIGGNTYLTVNGNGCNDCLVQVNPTTGALIANIGALGHSEVYGLAFSEGVAYGFSADGSIFAIDATNAATTLIPFAGAPPGLMWYGAGSSTAAPARPTAVSHDAPPAGEGLAVAMSAPTRGRRRSP